MKTWIAAILVSVSLGGSAWGQSPRPQTAADLGKYLGADRERLLYEGAKKKASLYGTRRSPRTRKSPRSLNPGTRG